MQLGLDLPYPSLSPIQLTLQFVGVHRRNSRHSIVLAADLLAPLAMYAAFPRSDYYGASVPSQVLGRRRTLPSTGLDARSDRRPGSVPTFTLQPIDE